MSIGVHVLSLSIGSHLAHLNMQKEHSVMFLKQGQDTTHGNLAMHLRTCEVPAKAMALNKRRAVNVC